MSRAQRCILCAGAAGSRAVRADDGNIGCPGGTATARALGACRTQAIVASKVGE